VSAAVRDAIADGVHAEIVDLGECFLKHVEGGVRAFMLRPPRAPLSRSDAGAPPPEQLAATVAIVPFVCMADNGTGHAIGCALADAIIARLCRVPGLSIVARLSTASMAGADNLADACRQHLGAHYVVTGTCASLSGWARGVANVVDARTRATIWTDGFAIELDALFQDRDAALAEMVQGISHSLCSHAVQRARSMPMPNLESFALYLGGVTLLHRLGRSDFLRSHDLLSALRDRHPRAAAPLAMLAKWHMLRVLQGWSSEPREEGRRGLSMAMIALDKEPDHPVALSMAGLLGVHFGAGLEAARAMAERAVHADPQEPSAWMTLAGIESYLARGAESVAYARRAILLSPLDPCRFLFELLLGAGELVDGRAEDAIRSIQASMRLNAVHAPTYRLAVIAYMLSGRTEAAREAAARLIALDPGFRVSDFADRYPGRDQPHAPDYVRALREAGLPG
jgi:TolB-like protein